MIIILILFFISSVAAIFLLFRCLLLIQEVERLEEDVQYFEESIYVFKDRLMQAQIRMKEIDIRGAFESDDEVGYTFKELQEIVDDTNKFIEQLYERDNTRTEA
jgi:hypothetical protein